ncbi:MAG TPA: flagellar basal body rod protein FlgC [Symbiobacteriaceae bacterium]|nr:flagellar basal body rod protein FlgC [Symbiobacteriaceae bacterium]
MRMFRSMETSTSALTAERLKMDLIANNLANINTTRGPGGEPYRRKVAVQEERRESFQDIFAKTLDNNKKPEEAGNGVRIMRIQEDPSAFKMKYDPTHPDADKDGMVRLPNVDMTTEMLDMMMAQRVYEANVTAFNVSKSMALKALEIGR